MHHWRPVHESIGSHTAGTLLEQILGNKLRAKLVLGYADVTYCNTKDKARLLAPQLLEAWQKVLGERYDADPNC